MDVEWALARATGVAAFSVVGKDLLPFYLPLLGGQIRLVEVTRHLSSIAGRPPVGGRPLCCYHSASVDAADLFTAGAAGASDVVASTP